MDSPVSSTGQAYQVRNDRPFDPSINSGQAELRVTLKGGNVKSPRIPLLKKGELKTGFMIGRSVEIKL